MMAGRVSLARKNLFQDRRRASLAISGVAASLVLVLVLDGVFAGAMGRVTAYMRGSPADVFVSQQDVRTMHMSASAIPADTVEAVRAVDGVAWAEALRYTTSIVDAGGSSRLTYVLGYDVASGRAGPRRLAAGRPPGTGEILVDDVVADELGIDVGDVVNVLGDSFRVSGLATDGTNLVNTTVYITAEDFARLRGDSIAYVLAGADEGTDPSQLADRLGNELAGVTVQTRAEFVSQEGRIVRDMATDVMQIMTIVGFLIALAVIGLTLFTATMGKLHEYGVVKALGAGSSRLAATVLAQAAWSVVIGLVVAVAVATLVGAGVTALTPNVQISIEPGSIIRTAAGALVVGGLASLLPLRRVVRVDPVTAFRRP